MSSDTTFDPVAASAAVSPALIASTLDCLALLPKTERLVPAQLMIITGTLARDGNEAAALLVRIRAAAIVMRDQRWPSWSTYFKSSDTDQRCAFDSTVSIVIAGLPLDATLKFDADAFFDALLARVPAEGRS